jgi:hypothetical protein
VDIGGDDGSTVREVSERLRPWVEEIDAIGAALGAFTGDERIEMVFEPGIVGLRVGSRFVVLSAWAQGNAEADDESIVDVVASEDGTVRVRIHQEEDEYGCTVVAYRQGRFMGVPDAERRKLGREAAYAHAKSLTRSEHEGI